MEKLEEFWKDYALRYIDKNISDKGTTHDYINGYYTNEFTDRNADIHLVEIGIADGYSMVLWREWFHNAKITAIEKYPYQYYHKEPWRIDGATSIFEDAYEQSTVDLFEDDSIDYLIDDGPHTLQSQMDCINLYWPKIKIGGKIIIEDVQSDDHLLVLKSMNIPSSSLTVFDLRANKGRYDDVILEITKNDR